MAKMVFIVESDDENLNEDIMAGLIMGNELEDTSIFGKALEGYNYTVNVFYQGRRIEVNQEQSVVEV